MNLPADSEHRDQPDDPREICKWTRIYAQNRSLGFVVFMIFFVLLSIAIGGSSYLTLKALLEGRMVWFWIGIAACVVAVGALIYFSTPRWGGRKMERMARRLYAKEGNVLISGHDGIKPLKPPWFLLVGFMACVLAEIILGMLGYIPRMYMQPVSALYVVPFLVILGWMMRPMASSIVMALWPILYGLHAIGIVAGAPILFTGKWEILNMFLPTAGYGLLCGFIAHAYSRYALSKLKRVARKGFKGTGIQEGVNQS